MEFLIVGLLAFAAGFVDAAVGGGGLIQIPGLFAMFPAELPARILGTNKFASICGTSISMWNYARRVRLRWQVLVPAFVAALPASWLGAEAVRYLSRNAIRPVILILLILVAVYTFFNKSLGIDHRPRIAARYESLLAVAVGGVCGLYDGFFGPGTGAFLIFVFVRVFGYDFLHASASAKIINWATNFGALALFALTGNVIWAAALVMAACNIAGGWTGSHLALKHGSGFVRAFFLFVLIVLIGKFAYDTFQQS